MRDVITAAILKATVEEIRDELTDMKGCPLVWPFGLDIIANMPPTIQMMIVNKLNARIGE